MLNKKTEKVKSWKLPGHFIFTTLSVLIFCSTYLRIQAQTIAPYFFGQNAWMPYAIGSNTLYGQLDSHWQEVKDSRCVSVRIGGIAYDQNNQLGAGYITQLCSLINTIQLNGAEPIVQVSFNDGAFTAANAASVVTAINITNLSSIQRKVKYWIIGNEPDGQYIPNNHNTASAIATYIIAFSNAMKQADGSIKIIGPELTFYNSKGGNIFEILTDNTFGLLKGGGG